MPTIISSFAATVGKSVSMVDEANYLAARSGSGESGGTEGTGTKKMNIGIRSEKTKNSGDIVHSYTIMRHVIRFIISTDLPTGAQVTDASITLTAGGLTQALEGDATGSATDGKFSYATSSISVVAGTGTGLIAPGDYDSVNITDGTGDLTDRGVTFRTYDDIDSGSAVPTNNGGTVTIQLNDNAFDDITSTSSGSTFDIALINTKFDKGGTVANPGSFLSGSEPGTPKDDDDVAGQFTPPGNSHDDNGTDIHHEGTFIKFFGDLGYGGQGEPTLTYTYKEIQPAGKVSLSDGKIKLSNGKISQQHNLI